MKTLPARSGRLARGLLLGMVVAALISTPDLARTQVAEGGDDWPHIVLFTHVTCPYCAEAKRYVEDLQRRMPGLTVRIRELSEDRRAAADLQALARQVGVRSPSVPAWVIGGEVFLMGFGGRAMTGRQIEEILSELGLPGPATPDDP